MKRILEKIKGLFSEKPADIRPHNLKKFEFVYSKYEVTTLKYYGLQGFERWTTYLMVGNNHSGYKSITAPKNYKLLVSFMTAEEVEREKKHARK